MSEEKKEYQSKIKLSKGKYLIRDSYCMWIAQHAPGKTKAGDDVDRYKRLTGYFTTYEDLLDGYVRDLGRQTKGNTIQEHLEDFKAIEKELRSLGRTIGKALDAKEAANGKEK